LSSPVEIRDLRARYGGVEALRGVSLSVAAGEFLAVIGPSGCGKTTLLRCLAGFLAPAGGSIAIGGELVANEHIALPPERRGIGLVFQNYALWPQMTAVENVAYPWRVRGVGKSERRRRAAGLLAEVGLSGLEERRPAELSGGQQQRVALARALACEPRLLLLDEPLSNVDAALRQELQDLIVQVSARDKLTTILATHDQDEALALADRVAILRDGLVAQTGTPAAISVRPVNAFVARFVGAGNILPVAILERRTDCAVVVLPDGSRIAVAGETPADERALLVCRPDQVRLADAGGEGIAGVVTRATLRNGQAEYRVQASGLELRAWEPGLPARRPGEAVTLSFGQVVLLPAEE
jgi:iron(III) transport system ATP-binding protein